MPRCFMAKKLKYPYEQWKQEQERSTTSPPLEEHLERSNRLASQSMVASETGQLSEPHSKSIFFAWPLVAITPLRMLHVRFLGILNVLNNIGVFEYPRGDWIPFGVWENGHVSHFPWPLVFKGNWQKIFVPSYNLTVGLTNVARLHFRVRLKKAMFLSLLGKWKEGGKGNFSSSKSDCRK